MFRLSKPENYYMKIKAKNKSPINVGFGYVDFPFKSDGWVDAELGVCTVRILVVDAYSTRVESSASGFEDIAFDDVIIATDIHDDPQTGFNFIQDNKNYIVSSHLVGHISWVGVGYGENNVFWACTYADLTAPGKLLYDQLQNKHIGCQLVVLTSLCRDKETIKFLMEETEKRGLPKLSCVMS